MTVEAAPGSEPEAARGPGRGQMAGGEGLQEELRALQAGLQEIRLTQRQHGQGLIKVGSLSGRLDGLERRQEEVVRLLLSLRSELAGISSGMARRDSLLLGHGPLLGARRDSLQDHRRESVGSAGSGRGPPVLEVEPWDPPGEVAEVLERLLERQFLLSPWVREKRLRNQLRLVLKDHLEAGPARRSTVTKVVYDAHQLFPVWRNQIRESMFECWESVQEAPLEEAAEMIFGQFKKPRFPDEVETSLLYTEHMVEVGQFLKRKAEERAGQLGRQVNSSAGVTNSKFWYEVRKKISEVVEATRSKRNSLQPQEESDTEADHADLSPQNSFGTED